MTQLPTEELIDNADRGRFELYRDGDHLVSWLYYTHLKPNRYALLHTEVESNHQHQGLGIATVRRVLDEIRARGATITAICPFVVDYLSGTTIYADLVDRRHPGYSDRAAAESARQGRRAGNGPAASGDSPPGAAERN